jgi:hypothetical protein
MFIMLWPPFLGTFYNSPWRQRIWKASCPLKCKLFTWLMLENKLLFWNNLQARGWEGPSRCSLCAQDIETSLHVFVLCPFTSALWTATTVTLKIPNLWMAPVYFLAFNTGYTIPALTQCCQFTCAGSFGWPETMLSSTTRSLPSSH